MYTQIANKLLCIYRFDQPVPKFDALTAKLEIREHSISNLRFVGGVVLDGWGGTGCSLPLVYLGGGGKCVYTDYDFCVYVTTHPGNGKLPGIFANYRDLNYFYNSVLGIQNSW